MPLQVPKARVSIMFAAFKDFMDQIYFPGYTEEILMMNKALYDFEWKNFLNLYKK